ncbi:MAG: hypothetical protein BGN82_07955 [Alphaproteobacteria bacterium 65-7]|nr:MAG: hypothetical protein BGN82_07955 [Alphaproteobacteria bacterium 65-7]
MDLQAIFDNYRRTLAEHYFDMNGRVGRAQFWYFILASAVVGLGVVILQSITILPLVAIYNLALLLPTAALGARRLQDTGRDGKLVWIFIFVGVVSQLISILALMNVMMMGFGIFLFLFGTAAFLVNLALLVVAIGLIWFWCQPGDPGPNAYGPVPPVFDPSRPVSPAP